LLLGFRVYMENLEKTKNKRQKQFLLVASFRVLFFHFWGLTILATIHCHTLAKFG
jgi:hypothetical protein